VSTVAKGASGRRVLVLGGTSEIAQAILGELQRRAPREIALGARDGAALGERAEQLRAAGSPRVLTFELDALAFERHAEVLAAAFAELGGADIVILAVGELGERGGLPDDIAGALRVLEVNTVGAGSLLMHAARELRGSGGTIVVLSSVAAERPRRANAVYGAAKAGLDSLAQSLADDLHDHGVRILVVRPGFVRSKMTRGLKPAPLASTPEAVGAAVLAGLEGRAQTIWVPRALRLLMLVMRMIPRPLFRRIEQ
jgi:decaprenylphospho-beta-D-erythro-pentofuranosid-2-ulose 2-reductase